jgi:transcription termination factor Rho
LEQSPLADLHTLASEMGIEGYRRLRRDDLVTAILGGDDGGGGDASAEPSTARGRRPAGDGEDKPRSPRRRGGSRSGRGRGRGREAAADADSGDAPAAIPDEDDEAASVPDEDLEVRTGVLDILSGGTAFLRAEPFKQSEGDVYVSPAQIRRCELRPGDELSGPVRAPRRSERHPSLTRVDSVNGAEAEPPAERPKFDSLTPVFPTEPLAAPRVLAEAPFGKGSRVAIGGPPGARGTALLREVASTLRERHPDLDLVIVLGGVRPEEVTEWRRAELGPVAGGSFESSGDEHAQAAEMAVERAKRAVERGQDAVVIVDSLDGLPAAATRRIFGAGRNTEEAGSLTIVATTGLAEEPQRFATTRILLEPDGGVAAAGTGTLRAELLVS